MTTEIKRLLADALACQYQHGTVDAVDHSGKTEKLSKHAEEAKAALVAGLDALTGAARVYLAEATFPANSDDCWTCGGGHSVVHQPGCSYDAAEQALRAALEATDGGDS